MRPLVVPLGLLLVFAGCGYSRIVEEEKDVLAAWAGYVETFKAREAAVGELLAFFDDREDLDKDFAETLRITRATVAQTRLKDEGVPKGALNGRFELAQLSLANALVRLNQAARSDARLGASEELSARWARLVEADERFFAARERYDEASKRYNRTVLQFPTSIGASLRGRDLVPLLTAVPARLSGAAP